MTEADRVLFVGKLPDWLADVPVDDVKPVLIPIGEGKTVSLSLLMDALSVEVGTTIGSMSIAPELQDLFAQFTEKPGWRNLPTESTHIERTTLDSWHVEVGDFSRIFTGSELREHVKQELNKCKEKTPELSDIKIVHLKPDDWATLRELKLRSMEQEPIAFDDQMRAIKQYLLRTEDEWRDKLDEEKFPRISVFAEDNGNYIGMVSALLNVRRQRAQIHHLFVDGQGYRGRGIGRRLMTTLINEIKARGNIKTAYLGVMEEQKAARKLYESLGFVEVGRRTAMRDGKPHTEIRMELSL